MVLSKKNGHFDPQFFRSTKTRPGYLVLTQQTLRGWKATSPDSTFWRNPNKFSSGNRGHSSRSLFLKNCNFTNVEMSNLRIPAGALSQSARTKTIFKRGV